MDHVAVLEQFLLDRVELPLWHANRRKDGLAGLVVAVLTDHDVPAAEVLKVIGEGAKRADDGVGVPARLVLDPVDLDRPVTEQVFEVQGNWPMPSCYPSQW